ncbi:MAG: RNA helicase [Candidatus Thorarchaeota archaeon]|nr:MAG: RNA helicase [Candidatus Thorarchaeota archaeon]
MKTEKAPCLGTLFCEATAVEVVDAEIKKRLSEPYVLLLRRARQEMATLVGVFSEVLSDRQRASLTGMVEYGYRAAGLLEIKRAYFIRYNKPVYFQEREFHEILRKANNILIPGKEVPSFIEDLRTFLARIQTARPRIVPVCPTCLRDDRLTVLSRRNAVKVSESQVSCISCAQSDLKTELKNMGITLSRAMVVQLERQVSRVKSVPRLLEMLTPGFDPTRERELTLFDTISVGESGPVQHISALPIPEELARLLQAEGIQNLLPVQQLAVESGLLRNASLLVVSSTSSGKTLIAELAGIPKAVAGERLIYIAPLVALTNEKYEQFRKRYRALGLRTGIRVGMSRLDVGNEGRPIVDTDISKADIICATYEALDTLFRSGESAQLDKVGTIVVDEIQNLADPERGPELDGLVARLRYHAPRAQILCLSATVGTPENLAKELKLTLVNHTGRPVPLERHLVFAHSEEDKREVIRRLVLQEFHNTSSAGFKGQSIVFTYSRRRAHALSDWLRENGTSSTVYHGGLTYSRRRHVESAYSKQRYACVVTTAALGAGVDLPASQVIFESLAMGSDWLTNAEFEQMLGRAGRLGKHDNGLVYLLVQPERKYHSGQERTEDEVAVDLLNGVVENVEPTSDIEACAEQILATICSTGLIDFKDVARAYNDMLSTTVPASEALKYLVRHHMIRVQDNGVYPTELGKATSVSFLTPSEGLDVLKHIETMDVLDTAIRLEPFDNVYLSAKLQAEVDAAFKTHMPTRLFSGVMSDLADFGHQRESHAKFPGWVYEVFSRWIAEIFNCGCRDFPECDHGMIRLGRWIVERRKEGLNPSGIAKRLHDDFELWAYPGDLFTWLDSLIHNLKAVQRIAAIAGKTDLGVQIDSQIARIERPLEPVEVKE